MSLYSDKINDLFRVNPSMALKQLQEDDAAGTLEATYLLGRAYYNAIYIKPDPSVALPYWEKGAALGDIDCQNALGDCHFFGFGYPEDNGKALEIYQEIVRKNPDYYPAICQIGRMFGHGWGIAKDISRSIEILTEAWNKGSARAATEIGLLYMFDMEKSVENIKTAIKWYQRGADKNDSKGCHRMGLLYHFGDYGIPKSPKMAFQMFYQGKEQDRALAMLITTNGCGVATDEEMKLIWEEAERRAEFGSTELQEALGEAYAKGIGVAANFEQAVKWYDLASNNGNTFATYQLGIKFKLGMDGFPEDFEKAYHYLRKAAEAGETYAMKPLAELLDDEWIPSLSLEERNAQKIYWFDKSIEEAEEWYSAITLGRMYENGYAPVDVDVAKAIHYYQIAADHDIDMAYMPLAKLYLLPGPTSDYKMAHRYLTLVKEKATMDFQIAEIEYCYGKICKEGLGVPRNLEDAQKHFAIAAAKGSEQAKEELSHFKKGLFGWKLIE